MLEISNESVLKKTKESETLLCIIKREKVIWIRHILRKSGIQAMVLEGTVDE